MSGTASVANTFANAVTATGLQLDNNFTTVVAYLNDPTNRNNYAADGGTTNTVVLTFSPPVVGGYTAGLQITFKSAAANTGAVVLNANGLGNVNLFSPAGQALGGGEITAGQMVSAAYDGTQFQMLSGVANLVGAATQAQQEAASATNVFVTPGRQFYNPLHAKVVGWLNGTATGTITSGAFLQGTGVSKSVRAGTGTYVITFASAFSNTTFQCLASSTNVSIGELPSTRTTASITLLARNNAAAATDAEQVSFAVYGDLP